MPGMMWNTLIFLHFCVVRQTENACEVNAITGTVVQNPVKFQRLPESAPKGRSTGIETGRLVGRYASVC